MTNTPLTRAKLKEQNASARQELVKAEQEDARRLELEQTARLRAQRLAKEDAKKNTVSVDTDKNAASDKDAAEWPWDYPQAHRT